RQGMVSLDLQYCNIRRLINTHNRGLSSLHKSIVRVGREAHPDLVRAFDHVIVGNDVAAWVHNHARAERLALLPALVRAHARHSEEVMEEILKIIWSLILVAAAVIRALLAERRCGKAPPAVPVLLGQFHRADVHHRWPHLLGNPREVRRKIARCGYFQWRRVRGVDLGTLLRFLPVYSMRDYRADKNACGKSAQDRKCGNQTTATEPL